MALDTAHEIFTGQVLRQRGEDDGKRSHIRINPEDGSRRAPVAVTSRTEQIAEVGAVGGPVQSPSQTPGRQRRSNSGMSRMHSS